MVGERDLDKMLATLSPTLADETYVFCSFERAEYGDYSELQPIAAVCETEGLTLVVPKFIADEHGFDYESSFCCITLNVHSSLDAVGLTAAFSGKLAERGISANVIAGYYHDHILVPENAAKNALQALDELGG